MSRFTNDVDTVGEMLNTTLVQIISGGILIVGTVVLMLYTNLILGGITILMAPVLTMVSKQIIKKSRGAYKDQQKNLGMLNGYAEETISGQKVVKVFGHEDTCIEEFEYLNNEVCEAQIKAQFRSGIMGPVTHQMCNMIYAITAAVGALMIVYRGFDIGGLTISLNYTRQFNRPINEISMQMNTVFAAIAGAAIAKGKPMKTALNATKLAIGAFIIPYMFVYNPQMLMIDSTWVSVLFIVFTALIGMFGISVAFEGYAVKKTGLFSYSDKSKGLITTADVIERLLFATAGLLCIIPETRTDIIGLCLMVALIVINVVQKKILVKKGVNF